MNLWIKFIFRTTPESFDLITITFCQSGLYGEKEKKNFSSLPNQISFRLCVPLIEHFVFFFCWWCFTENFITYFGISISLSLSWSPWRCFQSHKSRDFILMHVLLTTKRAFKNIYIYIKKVWCQWLNLHIARSLAIFQANLPLKTRTV